MTISVQHRRPDLSDFVSAVAAVCRELDAADEAEELERHVGWVSHSCEPDYQVLVELISPQPGLVLQLVIDLDVDAEVDTAQVVGTVDGESRAMAVEISSRFLAHLVEHHLSQPSARSCDDCAAPLARRPLDRH